MAYFEYGYVNTNYDEDSATEPIEEEYNSILNMVYSITAGVQESIVDFNYSASSTGVINKIVDFNYSSFAELVEDIITFHYEYDGSMIGQSILSCHYDIQLPVLPQKGFSIHLSVGEKTSDPVVRILRKDEND